MPKRLLFGRGFDAFWDDPSLRSNAENGWTVAAAHAHNGYVDATLAMGLIGLALTLWALVLQPLADIARRARARRRPRVDDALRANLGLRRLGVVARDVSLRPRQPDLVPVPVRRVHAALFGDVFCGAVSVADRGEAVLCSRPR